MAALYIPEAIHVDPNMHENLYRDLLHFAIVFDRVSLYAVFGGRLERYFPLGISGFAKLVQNPQPGESAFLLTAPSDFYDEDRRNILAQNPEMEWTDFERWVRDRRGRGTIIHTSTSKPMRERAWDTAKRYRDSLRESFLNGQNQTLKAAHDRARAQFEIDRRVAEPGKRILPAIFFQDVVIPEAHYKEFLDDGDVLPLLAYENYTKPQIIESIEAKLRSLDPSCPRLAMYVPSEWHSLLIQGWSFEERLGGTGDFIEAGRRLVEENSRFQPILNELREFDLEEQENGDLVDAVLQFRRQNGPKQFRSYLEKLISTVAVQPDTWEHATQVAFDEVMWLTRQMRLARDLEKKFHGLLLLSLISAGFLFVYLVPGIRSQAGFWHSWYRLVVDASRSDELCHKVAAHIVQPGYDEGETKVAMLLSRLVSSAQPKKSLMGLG